MKFEHILKQPKYRNLFLGALFFIFVLMFSVFNILSDISDNIPIAVLQVKTIQDDTEDSFAMSHTEPIKIRIDSVAINVDVIRPQSKDVAILDQSLLKGAVYYPGSGSVEKGNMLVFGHSTGLSVVRNQAFRAFNNLKNVSDGDLILVTGEDGVVYRYIAKSAVLVDESEALVQFDTRERMITLSTCNTFGKKQERHVVKAYFDGIEG
jgi:LPXTG-site transpeptidase (sortase) family protein